MKKEIYIIGLGVNPRNDLTLKSLRILQKADKVYLRTSLHPEIDVLKEYDIEYETFDSLYETADDFDSLYEKIADTVLSTDAEMIAYAVPGSSLYAEKSASLIANNDKDIAVKTISGVSFVDSIFTSLKIDPIEQGCKIIDALSLDIQRPDTRSYNIICQIHNSLVASETKLSLMQYYNDETPVILVNSAGTDDEQISYIKLYELDRQKDINHLTSLVIPPVDYSLSTKEIVSAKEIVALLRSDDGCPWDKVQTHKSLANYLIEEVYEVIEAIEDDDDDALYDELGDILFHILLHCQIGSEDGTFNLGDVIDSMSSKLIRRHPYVFAGTELTTDDTHEVWDEIKAEEKNHTTYTETLKTVPATFPALMYCSKVQKRAGKAGMDFKNYEESLEKIYEELEEMKAEIDRDDTKLLEEAGDLLFSAVNTLRMLGIDSEDALRKSTDKFIKRFEVLEGLILDENLDITALNSDILEKYWEKSKKMLII